MSSILNWFKPVWEISATNFELAGHAILAALPLAVIVLAINLAFRRWLSAWQINLLWGIVLVRLMIPFAPASTMSVQNMLTMLLEDSSSTATDYWETTPYPSDDADAAAAEAEEAKAVEARRQAHVDKVLASTPAVVESADRWWLVGLDFIVCAIVALVFFSWPLVAVVSIVWTLVANFRFTWKVNRSPFSRDERLAGLWAACCELAKVRRTIPIVLLEKLQQPAMMGVVHHRLLLPIDAIQWSDDELRMIMLHELAHVRQRDIAINWALVFVRAVHWWNPIYWLAASRFAATREQACDAFVVQRLAGVCSRNYGELLLKLAAKMPGRGRWRVLVPTPILGFMLPRFRRRVIAGRLKALPRAAIVRRRWQIIAVAVGTVLLGYAGFTDAKTASEPFPAMDAEAVFPAVFERADAFSAKQPKEEEPVVARTYEVERALRSIAGKKRSIAEARELLLSVLKQFLAPKELPECSFDGDQLKVVAKESTHQELRQNLLAWEKSGLEQICIECRFLVIRPEDFARVKIPWRYFAPNMANSTRVGKDGSILEAETMLPGLISETDHSGFRAHVQYQESTPLIYSILSPMQARYVVVGAQRGKLSEILNAPKVTVFNGTRCFIQDVTQRPFVVGVNPVVGESETALQPQIAVYEQGTKIFMRPILSADHKRIQLNGRLELSSIDGVQTASVRVPELNETESPATIQVPNLRRLSVDISAEIEKDHSIILGSPAPKPTPDGRYVSGNLFVVLTPRLISDDGDAAK